MSILQFSGYKFCTNFVGFLFKYFMFLKMILLFIFQLSIVSCIYFYILAWYPVKLLDPLINSMRFFVDILKIFSEYNCHPWIKTVFSFLSSSYAFFSSLITLARFLSTVLSRSNESRYPCFVFSLWRENVYSFIINYDNRRRRQWHPTPVLLPGKSYERRSLVGCSPWGRWGSDTTERLHFHFSLSCMGEGNGSPLQCSCLENPRDRGAWWAAIYGVTQSRTQLNWLSSSSSMILEISIY